METSNVVLKSIKNSRSDGMRLKTWMDLAVVMSSRLNNVPPFENRLATALSVVQDEG